MPDQEPGPPPGPIHQPAGEQRARRHGEVEDGEVDPAPALPPGQVDGGDDRQAEPDRGRREQRRLGSHQQHEVAPDRLVPGALRCPHVLILVHRPGNTARCRRLQSGARPRPRSRQYACILALPASLSGLLFAHQEPHPFPGRRTNGPGSCRCSVAWAHGDARRARGVRGGARDRRHRLRAGGALPAHGGRDRRTAKPRPVRRHALHDGAARGLLPSGAARPGGAQRRLGGPLLLPSRTRAGGRRGEATPLHVVRRLRRAAGGAGRARGPARRSVPGPGGRERPCRSRGCRPGRSRLLRQEHDADHAPLRLVGRARHARDRRARSSPRPQLDLDCGDCRLCIDACPTGALDEPGVLDATRCLSYWTQSSAPAPDDVREQLGDRVYGCDTCQDVCPWNRGIEKRRAGTPDPPGLEPAVSLADWLGAPPGELRDRYARLFVPRNDGRHLQRNAILASEHAGDASLLAISSGASPTGTTRCSLGRPRLLAGDLRDGCRSRRRPPTRAAHDVRTAADPSLVHRPRSTAPHSPDSAPVLRPGNPLDPGRLQSGAGPRPRSPRYVRISGLPASLPGLLFARRNRQATSGTEH